MAASLSAGVNSLILKLDTPYDSLRTYDIRDDLVKVKVWCSTTSGFTPSDSNLVFNASGLSIIISSIPNGTSTPTPIVAGTTYYVKYAFISAIEESEFTILSPTPAFAVPVTGAAGSSVSMVFKRSATQPATPDPSASTPAGWYPDVNSVPVGTDAIWTSVGSKSSTATLFTWQTPVRVEGEGGVRGDSARIAYKTQSQQLAAPVISETNSQTTGNTSFPTGWSGTITTPTAGQSLWAVDGIFNTPSNKTTWSTPYLTQGFPTTIQSDNYNANTLGWQIQRDTGNAFFNNVTARGSLITGDIAAQRIEINKVVTPGTATTQQVGTNRLEAFSSNNIRFLTLGGSGGTTQDTAVIGISANNNVINPVWIESSADIGSNILSNTLGKANAISSVSNNGGRLFYGYVTGPGANAPKDAFQIDVNSPNHTGNAIAINMGASTGSAISVGGSGDGYAIDAVTNTSGAAGTKSGIAYFRGIDFPTTQAVLTGSGSQAKITVNFTNLNTAGELTYSFTLEGVSYSFPLEYDFETFNSLPLFVSAIAASINNTWQVSYTTANTASPFASGSFILTKPTVGVATGTNSGSIGTFTGSFVNGTAPTYTTSNTKVRLTPFPNDTTKVLRGDGSWGTVAGSGGYVDLRYSVRDYGAKGDNSTDDTAAIQATINMARTTGGTVYFPRGVYTITSSLNYTAIAGNDPIYRVHFAGDGIGASLIRQIGSGDGLVIAGYTGSPINPNLYTHISDLQFVGSGSGQGLSITNGAYVYVEACHFTNWAYGFYGSNFLSSTFSACAFRFNQRGFVIERIAGGNYASSPNALTMLNCEIGANSLFGGWVLGPGVFTMQGGAIEGNGTTSGSTSNWGLKISEPSGSTAIESAVGVSLDGVYFEVNSGIADLWIESSSAKPGVTNNINGCSFVRISSNYPTYSILLYASSAANSYNNVISGCGFKGLSGYTPSASRMTISNYNTKVQLLGCSFDSVVDAYVTGDENQFETALRVPDLKDLSGNKYIEAATQYKIPFYSISGTKANLSGADYLTYSDNGLYVNQSGVTDLRLSYNLPGITAPGMTSKGSAVGIASGFNNSTGAYTAGVLVTNNYDSAPSFSGNATGGTKMNLGTSIAAWDKFYWGTAAIPAPAGSTTTFLRNDGTWAVAGTGTVNTSTAASQLAYYSAVGTAVNGTTYLTYEDNALYVNKAGVTDLRLGYSLPNVIAPGMTTTGSALAIAAGFNNSSGVFTAGLLLSRNVDGAASFSGTGDNNTTKMNLGTSASTWGKFYWGTVTTGIAAPSGDTTKFLRNDGTWIAPAGGISSVTGTSPVNASTTSGAVTISMSAASSGVNGYMTSTYATKLDGIATGATVNSGNVNAGSINQLTYYSATGSTVSGTTYLTYEDNALYINKPGVTDLRLGYSLPGVIAPGMTTTGSALAIAAGFNNSSGAFTAGVLISRNVDNAASFSGVGDTNTTKMNLGTSSASWGKFYWGTAGIDAPAGSTATFLRNDGTWASPVGAVVSSITGTAPISASASTGAVTLSMAAASSGVNGYMTGTYATKLDGIAAGATNVTNTNQLTNGASFITLGSISATAPVSYVSGVISMAAASSGVNGYMTGTYATKLDGIAAGATNVTNTNQLTNGAGYITTAVTSVGGTGSGLGFSLSGSVTTTGNLTLAAPTVAALQGTLGLGALAYVSSLTSFTELNNTALAGNPSATGSRILGTYNGARAWATMAEVRAVLADQGGTAGSTTFLRGDGYWAVPAEADTLATVTSRGASTTAAISTGTISVTGSITATGDITAYSDVRLKTNIKPISNAFKGSEDIYGVTYTRTDTGDRGMGFIAQDFEKHYPDIVNENEDGMLSLKYLNIIAILWEQNRELHSRVQALEVKHDSTSK
jgi:hypothetical protein